MLSRVTRHLMAGASARAANAAAPALPVCCCWPPDQKGRRGQPLLQRGGVALLLHTGVRGNFGWGAGARAIWGAKSE